MLRVLEDCDQRRLNLAVSIGLCLCFNSCLHPQHVTESKSIDLISTETLVKLKHYESLQGDVSPTDRIKNMKEAEQMLKELSVLNFDLQKKMVKEEAENAKDCK